MNKAEFHAAGASALSHGFSIIGVYHSHPGGCPIVSEGDIAGMTFAGISLILSIGEEIRYAAYFVDCHHVEQLCIAMPEPKSFLTNGLLEY